MPQRIAAETDTLRHSLRSEITRVENHIQTASRLLAQHNDVLRRLEHNKEELDRIRQAVPEEMYEQLVSDNNVLIEKEKKEIDKLNNILRKLHQEKSQLQTEYERPSPGTFPAA